MKSGKITGWFLKLIGVGLFLWIISTIDKQAMLAALKAADWTMLLLAFLFFVPIYVLRAYRWHVLVRAAGIRLPFKTSFNATMASLFLGIVTPGRIGEVIRIPVIKAAGGDLRTGVSLTILDRLWDIGCIGVLGIFASAYLFGPSAAMVWAVTGVLVSAIIISRVMKGALSKEYVIFGESFFAAFELTAIIWALYYLQLLALSSAFGFTFAVPWFFAVMTFTGIVSVLPIAPAGLGTREAVLLHFFGQQSIDPATTVAFGLTIFLITLLASSIGIWHWMKLPLHRQA